MAYWYNNCDKLISSACNEPYSIVVFGLEVCGSNANNRMIIYEFSIGVFSLNTWAGLVGDLALFFAPIPTNCLYLLLLLAQILVFKAVACCIC